MSFKRNIAKSLEGIYLLRNCWCDMYYNMSHCTSVTIPESDPMFRMLCGYKQSMLLTNHA